MDSDTHILQRYRCPNEYFFMWKSCKINGQNYTCDSTGGYNYEKNQCPLGYLDNFKISDQSSYQEYTIKIKDIYQRKIELIGKISNLYHNPSLIKQYITMNYIKAIDFLKRYDIPIVEWISKDKIKDSFYNQVIKYIKHNTDSYIAQFENLSTRINIGYYPDIKITGQNKYDNLFRLSEFVYQYLDKRKDQKNIELFFNNKQKKLEKFLFDIYNINTNNKYVSRAYIKLYELLHDTQFFDNLKKNKIKSFHICEAPGNFIISIQDYIKDNTSIKEYDYVAQSYYDSDIFDDYGLIKNNRSRWDEY